MSLHEKFSVQTNIVNFNQAYDLQTLRLEVRGFSLSSVRVACGLITAKCAGISDEPHSTRAG